jgi:LysR family transcriptional regulator, hydrogen peroxide-inducible genes activator
MIVTLMPRLESKTLVQERLWEERLAVALPETHALARQTTLKWDQAAELRIILKDSHVELFAFRALLDRLDRQVHVEQHDVSCTTLLDMVGLGMGATIIPSSAIAPHRGVAFVPIDESDAIVGVDAVWPKDDRNPLRHRLLNLIRALKGEVLDNAGTPIPPATDQARYRD